MTAKTWVCKIGEADVPSGADGPMRDGVAKVYRDLTGKDPAFIFSGWGGHLTEAERATVDDVDPDPREVIVEIDEEIARLTALRASALSYLEG